MFETHPWAKKALLHTMSRTLILTVDLLLDWCRGMKHSQHMDKLLKLYNPILLLIEQIKNLHNNQTYFASRNHEKIKTINVCLKNTLTLSRKRFGAWKSANRSSSYKQRNINISHNHRRRLLSSKHYALKRQSQIKKDHLVNQTIINN